RVGRPMDGPPESVADPLAKEARDDHRKHEIDRYDAERDGKGPIGRREWDEGGADSEAGEWVDDRGDDVDPEKHDRQERQVAMELDRQEARPARRLGPGDGQQPEAGDDAEEDQGDDAGSTGGEPQDLGAHELGAPVSGVG